MVDEAVVMWRMYFEFSLVAIVTVIAILLLLRLNTNKEEMMACGFIGVAIC